MPEPAYTAWFLRGLRLERIMDNPSARSPNPWIESLGRWSGMAGWPGALSAGMSLSTLLGLSLLYRELPVVEAGILALLLSVSDIFAVLALLGMGTTITRLYSGTQPGTYNWPMDLLFTSIYALPVAVLGSIAFTAFYEFGPSMGAYLFVVVLLGTLLACAFAMLNSHGHHAWSAALIRLPNALLVIPGLAAVMSKTDVRLGDTLGIYLLSSAFALGLGIVVLSALLPRGTKTVPRKSRLEGLAFTATASTDLLADQGLIAAAGRVLPMGQLAGFAAVAILLRPFRLLRGVLAMILTPDLVRFPRASYRRLLIGFWTLAALCGVAAAILAPPIATWFYDTRYQAAISLIPYLALAGALLIGAIPPRADLGVRAPMQVVNRFALAYFTTILISLAVSLAGMQVWGAVFLAAAVVLVQAGAAAVAYGFWLRQRSRPARLPAE